MILVVPAISMKQNAYEALTYLFLNFCYGRSKDNLRDLQIHKLPFPENDVTLPYNEQECLKIVGTVKESVQWLPDIWRVWSFGVWCVFFICISSI